MTNLLEAPQDYARQAVSEIRSMIVSAIESFEDHTKHLYEALAALDTPSNGNAPTVGIRAVVPRDLDTGDEPASVSTNGDLDLSQPMRKLIKAVVDRDPQRLWGTTEIHDYMQRLGRRDTLSGMRTTLSVMARDGDLRRPAKGIYQGALKGHV